MEPVEIQPLVEADLVEICRTRAGLSGERADADPIVLERRLRWLVADNPARLDEVPPGWVLRTESGSIAGSMLCVPQRFARGNDIRTLLLSSGYYVEPPYRGVGLGIFMQYLQLAKTHLLFATTANQVSSELWKRFGATPVAPTDREWFGVLNWTPVAEEMAQRRVKVNGLSRMAAAIVGPLAPLARGGLQLPATGGRLDLLYDADDIPPLPAPAGAALRAVRDRSFVVWRFLREPDYDVELLCFTPSTGGGPSLVAVKHTTRGYRQQIRALVVLDVWGAAAPPDAVAAHLAARYADRTDAIVFRCQDPQAEAALARAGFVRRNFDVPIAWTIDRAGVLGGRELRLSPADGDMVL